MYVCWRDFVDPGAQPTKPVQAEIRTPFRVLLFSGLALSPQGEDMVLLASLGFLGVRATQEWKGGQSVSGHHEPR